MENKKYKVIIGILVVLLIAALCVICFLLGRDYKKDEPKKEQETKEVEKKEETKKEEKKEKKEEPRKENKVLFDATDKKYEDDKALVVLTPDNRVLVNYTNEDDKYVTDVEIATDVIETFDVHAGMSDICWGNEVLIIVTESKTLFLSIDDMMCANRLVTKELKGLEGITNVEEKAEKSPNNEPDDYKVYATTKDGKRIEITDKLELE